MTADLLSKYFAFRFPLETGFIDLFYRFRALWGNLSEKTKRQRILNDIYDYLEIWTAMSYEQTDHAKLLDYTLLCTRNSSGKIIHGVNSYRDLVRNLFAHYGRAHNTSRIGDKTVPYRHTSLETLQAALGNIRVVHVIRDPRDVCISWRKTWFGPPSISEAARLWQEHVVEKRAWGRQNPEDYLEVRYEDIFR